MLPLTKLRPDTGSRPREMGEVRINFYNRFAVFNAAFQIQSCEPGHHRGSQHEGDDDGGGGGGGSGGDDNDDGYERWAYDEMQPLV